MRLDAGGDIKRAVKGLKLGEALELSPGDYPPAYIADVNRPIVIRGNKSVIRASESKNPGLKFENCLSVTLERLGITDSKSHGVMVVKCGSLTVRGIQSLRNGGSGLLTANTSNVLVAGSQLAYNQQHGVYLSQSGDNLTVNACKLTDNHKAGIQVNAIQDRPLPVAPKADGISIGVKLVCNTLLRNQAAGGAGINLAGCRQVEINGNVFTEHNGRSGIALWDDGTNNAKFGCRDVVIERNIFDFRTGAGVCSIDVGDTCLLVQVSRNNEFPMGIKQVDGIDSVWEWTDYV